VSTSELEGHVQEAPATAARPLRADAVRPALPAGRAALAAPAVAAVALAAAVLATQSAGLPLRDPGAVTARRLVIASLLVGGLALVDIIVRAAVARGGMPSLRGLANTARMRWTTGRIAAVTAALIGYHVTYLAYRNIKSVAPLLRPGDVFDRQLLDVDRWVLGGKDPGALLHELLGTGAAAHSLSLVYMFFFTLIPVTLAAGLVLLPNLRAGLFVATALSLTWLIGAGSYLVLPSLGPFHFDPADFADLPRTAVTGLQESLLAKRAAFLDDPPAAGAAQSIGAFASLHTAICGTILLGAHLLRAPRALRAALWVLALLTVVATIYFGWHYLLDDVAGAVIAVVAVSLAVALTGLRRERT